MKNYSNSIELMSFEEKADLLTGFAMATKEFPQYGIKAVTMADGPAGVRKPWDNTMEGGDVAFPTESSLAMTWNRNLVYEVGKGLAENCIAHNVDMLLAPGVNLYRNPLCGRNYEYFSEDPYLAGELGAAYINGMQEHGVGTSLKHFIANTQERARSVINSEMDERTMRELYLKPFEMIVQKANPTTIMCAYNKVNGHYCSENKKILRDILRDEWGYDGMLISDWGAIHNLGKSIKAGMDFQMPANQNIREQLKEAYEKGLVSAEDIDNAVSRVIDFVMTIQDMKKRRTTEPYSRQKLHKLAKKAADEAIVLLKNDGILPIRPGQYKKIAVFGYYAEMPNLLGGGGGYDASGGVTVARESVDSPLKYIKQSAGDTEIIYAPLYDEYGGNPHFDQMRIMQKMIKEVDVVIMFGGYPQYYEVEGEDRRSLSLPHYMARLIEEAARFCKNTIVVLQTGCAVAPFMEIAEPRAILQMGYAGEAGGHAIADVLFGRVNPSGKLQCTYMTEFDPDMDLTGDGRKINYKEKMFIGYRYYDMHPEKVWYPFGYGLSYTKFAYSDLKISPEYSNDTKQKVAVSFKVKNIGKVFGGEIAQIYVSEREPSVLRPYKELKGFEKVFLEPGEESLITVELDKSSFAYYNTNENDWHVESGIYDILVGKSAAEICLRGQYVMEWEKDYTIHRDRWKHIGKTEFIGGEDL